MKKKIIAIQFAVKLGDIAYNQAKVRELVNQAYQQHQPDYILLPETWNLGFFPTNTEEVAEDFDTSTSYALLKEIAVKYEVNLIGGSIIVKDGENVFNRGLVFDREGNLVNQHDKGHLFSPSEENDTFTNGKENSVFVLDGIKVAHLICYDIRFPEYSRRLALEGAQMLFVSAEWPHPRLNHWKVLNNARAIENQQYVITANGCGEANGLHFCGHSAIIDPWGDIIVESGEEEEIVFQEIELNAVDEVRKKIPVFNDRNLDLY